MPIRIVTGDLLSAPQAVIAQQCCCMPVIPRGLSKSFADELRVDFYAKHKQRVVNASVARRKDRPEPGSIECEPIMGKDGQWAVALYAQYGHAKLIPTGPFRDGVPDGRAERLGYFTQCLQELALWMRTNGHKSVAFPYGIGCGMAGGKWPEYLGTLINWSKTNEDITVVMYKIEKSQNKKNPVT
jgi:hypothetical protein